MNRAVVASLFVTLIACSDDAYKHDPEPHRQQIEEIETLLAKPKNEAGDGGRLHTMCANLAGEVGKNIDNHTKMQKVMNLLISVGEVFAHQEEQDIPWDLEDARELWTTVREAVFKEVDWFRTL